MAMLRSNPDAACLPHRTGGLPTVSEMLFIGKSVRAYRDTLASDVEANARSNATLRENDVFKQPGKFHPSLLVTQADFEWAEPVIEGVACALSTNSGHRHLRRKKP
ncbi:hypothetical protein [Ostreiculturibacter nitratireducens]|uniref:hypothetical protein n=1 Tax=Ostreiculturibacter nitratireducens TaxID=3075226 RepID=UPI0031B63184